MLDNLYTPLYLAKSIIENFAVLYSQYLCESFSSIL